MSEEKSEKNFFEDFHIYLTFYYLQKYLRMFSIENILYKPIYLTLAKNLMGVDLNYL